MIRTTLLLLCFLNFRPLQAMELIQAQEFCQKWFAALVLGDGEVEEKLAHLMENFYAEGAVLIDPNFSEPQVGKVALKQYYRTVMTRYPNWEFEIEKIYPTDEGFVLHYQGKVPGLVEHFYGIDILEIDMSGKITKLVEGYDRTPFLRALLVVNR